MILHPGDVHRSTAASTACTPIAPQALKPGDEVPM
jgi:hypothetical protein